MLMDTQKQKKLHFEINIFHLGESAINSNEPKIEWVYYRGFVLEKFDFDNYFSVGLKLGVWKRGSKSEICQIFEMSINSY